MNKFGSSSLALADKSALGSTLSCRYAENLAHYILERDSRLIVAPD